MNKHLNNCLIDLHVHLDGSLSFDIVKRLCSMQGIAVPLNDEILKKKLVAPANCRNLNDYLKCFDFPLELMQNEIALKLAFKDLIKRQKEQGLMYSEIRFAPQLHTRMGLTQKQVVEAVVAAANDACDYCVGIILCCMRGQNNHEKNMETVSVAKDMLSKGVVGVDLAGAEGLYPTSMFSDIFEYASECKVPFTIHAGEAAGPESIKKAIEYGAKRIGHGISCINDSETMELIRNNNVTLELCPTSNINTHIFNNINEYPIKKLLEEDISITINTDNMTVSNTSLLNEFELLQNSFCLSDEIVKKLLINAAKASFTKNEMKQSLIQRIMLNI